MSQYMEYFEGDAFGEINVPMVDVRYAKIGSKSAESKDKWLKVATLNLKKGASKSVTLTVNPKKQSNNTTGYYIITVTTEITETEALKPIITFTKLSGADSIKTVAVIRTKDDKTLTNSYEVYLQLNQPQFQSVSVKYELSGITNDDVILMDNADVNASLPNGGTPFYPNPQDNSMNILGSYNNPSSKSDGGTMKIGDDIKTSQMMMLDVRGDAPQWWKGGVASGGKNKAVVSGELKGVASIAAYDSTLTNFNNLSINPEGNGNVGIGTYAPSSKLEVAGAVKATEFIGDGSKLTGVKVAAKLDNMTATNLTADSVSSKNLTVNAPDKNIYNMQLMRNNEAGKNHTWAFWHMNKDYGQDDLQLWEYHPDAKGNVCGNMDYNTGGRCHPTVTIKGSSGEMIVNRGGFNVKGGVSRKNPDNWWTHFPWAGDNKNYIRGDTEIRGDTNNLGNLNVGDNINIGGKMFFKDPAMTTIPGASNGSDPYYIEKVTDNNNNSSLRITVNDDVNEAVEIWGDSCRTTGCSGTGVKRHRFEASGDAEHTGEVKTPGLSLPKTSGYNWRHRTGGDAAIANADDYKTLMIVGRDNGDGQGRKVDVWDKLTVNGILEAPTIKTNSIQIGNHVVSPIDNNTLRIINVGGGRPIYFHNSNHSSIMTARINGSHNWFGY